jgi:hypothetical protein
MEKTGKGHLFEALKGTLTGDAASATYADLAPQFGITESALKATAHRMREHFRDHVQALILDTVNTPDEADEELQHLFSVLSVRR